MMVMAGTQKVYEALKRVEFSVGMDVWMTPTMLMCDYVLPGTYWFEAPSIGWVERCEYILGGDRILPKKVEGVYDRADFYDFWRGLGIRLGQEQYWPWKSTEDNLEFRLKKLGMTWNEWRKQPWMIPPGVKDRTYVSEGRFPTLSGKVELKSSILEQLGLEPLPDYQEPPESPISTPDLFKEYPLILITGARIRPFLHSQFRQISSTRKMHPDPLMEMNPQTAKELGLKDGDWVWIETSGASNNVAAFLMGFSQGLSMRNTVGGSLRQRMQQRFSGHLNATSTW
jgi:anaerobic selenocysteine-containing dehydrogenase